MSAKELRSTEDLSAILGVSSDTVRRLMRNGDLPALKIGRRWYVPDVEFNKLIGGDGNDANR